QGGGGSRARPLAADHLPSPQGVRPPLARPALTFSVSLVPSCPAQRVHQASPRTLNRQKTRRFQVFRFGIGPANAPRMLQTMPPTTGQNGSMLRVGVGIAKGSDALESAVRAATAARTDIDSATPHLAVVVTTAVPQGDLSSSVRSVLGPVGISGGVTSGLLTECGLITDGALVLCVSNADGGASGVAATSGRQLSDAALAAARLVLAGWPFRGRYPR